MKSYDDFEQLSPTDNSSSPLPKRSLKRLKKAQQVPEISSRSETLGSGNSIGAESVEMDLESVSVTDRLEEEDGSGLGGVGVEGEEFGAKRALDFDSMAEEFGVEGEGGDDGDAIETEEQTGDMGIDGSGNKRRVPDGTEETKKEKKKKRKQGVGFDELPVSYSSMNMTKKERREHLEQLRAENQRLLRETRDAAFKPVPVVQKPISSVLEKIRRRKLEVSRKFLGMTGSDCIRKEVAVDVEKEEVIVERMKNEKGVKETNDELTAEQNSLRNSNENGTSNSENHSNHETDDSRNPERSPSKVDQPINHQETNFESEQGLQAPADDTQDLSSDSQMSISGDEFLEKAPKSPLEEVMRPSILAMNLRLNSSPLHEDSSEEEDNNKENVDPSPDDSYPAGDPVRAFVDEEAEEEDDSDNDLLRFQDDEVDEDEEDEELKKMIVSQCKENPKDSEKRNELHQKWLENQDAAGTEKLLQKLKCGLQQNEASLLDVEEDEEDDENEEDELESDNNDEEDLREASATRMTMKKIKEMIPLMFTDKEDVYISSDDEEVETKLAKERLRIRTEVHKAKHLSPTRDESSKELLDRIKKVNSVPENLKKTKTSASADKLRMGGNMSAPSKSFLGRGQKNSLPPSHKRGSSVTRSFIFERDDSNSRSSISAAEESLDTIQPENHRPAKPSARFSNSQAKSSTQSETDTAETSSHTPLYEILKRSSLQARSCTRDTVVSHTESIFSAFKLEKKPPTR